jgi:hypothetical protein
MPGNQERRSGSVNIYAPRDGNGEGEDGSRIIHSLDGEGPQIEKAMPSVAEMRWNRGLTPLALQPGSPPRVSYTFFQRIKAMAPEALLSCAVASLLLLRYVCRRFLCQEKSTWFRS